MHRGRVFVMKLKRTKSTKYKATDDPVALLLKEAEVFYDSRGRKKKVILPYETYREIMDRLEDADDLRAVKEAETNEPDIPLSEFRSVILKRCR